MRGVEICQGLAGFQICDFPLADLTHESPALGAKSKPDLVLVERAAPDTLLIDTVTNLSERQDCAAIIFADLDDSDLIAWALRRGLTSYIVGGLQREKVELIARVALERFQIQRQLKAEVHKLRSELEARKVIEKAKGVIMQRRSLSEAEAYKALREVAMQSGRPLRDLSRDVLHLARVLGPDNADDVDQLAQLFTARERGVTRMARDILTAASLLGER